jgi:endonuclease/exonuclease/phosphatase (EEP) superfamily protein YafD
MSRRTRITARVALAAVWLVALGLVALVVARLVAHDDNASLALLNAQTVWVYLPAYAIASAAWCFRRYALAVLMTGVVLVHAIAVFESVGEAEPVPAAARAAPRLRLLSTNVRYTNPTPERLARELLAADADVLLVQEVTPEWGRVFDAAGFDERYPHVEIWPRRDAGGQAIYSTLPMSDVRVVERENWPTISARVRVGDVSVALVDVHTIGPPSGMSRHVATVDALVDLAESLPAPRVLAGDFNATPYNRTLDRIADLGLDSAHERRGRGLATTWPNGEKNLPPIRLDHVFVDDEIVILDVRELDGTGSDHKPVLVDLAIM